MRGASNFQDYGKGVSKVWFYGRGDNPVNSYEDTLTQSNYHLIDKSVKTPFEHLLTIRTVPILFTYTNKYDNLFIYYTRSVFVEIQEILFL